MSTTDLGRFEAPSRPREVARPQAGVLDTVRAALTPLASLRLTVALLSLSLILVLAGTLAQVDRDVWYVVREYFRTWVAWIEVRIFFPRSWGISENLVFPFPGGKLLGAALAVNLLAAHGVRFKVAARGARLWLGWATIALGAAVTYGVIASGSNMAVESELSPQFVNFLWHAVRAFLGGGALALVYVLALTQARARRSAARWVWWFGAVAAAVMVGLSVYLFTHPEARLNASGLRILWQLAKATGASIVLGAGCWAVFAKRAGIVLLHSGIALLMFSELLTAQSAVESQMRIAEGQTAYYGEDMRSAELAFTDASNPKSDRVTVVPAQVLAAAAKSGEAIDDPRLPFTVKVVEYLPNAVTRILQPGEASQATAGVGQIRTVRPVQQSTGVEAKQAFDVPAAFLELQGKDDKKSRGVFLLSPFLNPEALLEGDTPYEVALRFKRIPKPYNVTLEKFTFARYEGTNTAKNYQSDVRFRDPDQNVDISVPIYMNNPLRYGGDTLYQADWDRETERGTVLQVVTNSGWMIPYVACMIVASGMLVHFVQAIVRFVSRREDEARKLALAAGGGAKTQAGGAFDWRRPQVWGPALVVVAFASYVATKAMPVSDKPTQMKIHEFGKLPVAYGGRTQPMDTLARNALRMISGKSSYDDAVLKNRQPAVRWLLDVISQSPAMVSHKVFKVENIEVQKVLGLEHRKGSRYSLREVLGGDGKNVKPGELMRQAELARAVPEGKQDLTQAKFLEAAQRINLVLMLERAFSVPEFGKSLQDFLAEVPGIQREIARLNLESEAPRAIPPATPEGPWSTVYEASYKVVSEAVMQQRKPPADDPATQVVAMLDEYRAANKSEFNSRLGDLEKRLITTAAVEADHEADLASKGERSGRKSAERLSLGRIEFESWFNDFDPLFLCWIMYLTAFLLAILAWVGWFEGFNRASNWLLWFTFAIHTFGLVCRIYISGRPPVTNLYSAAVFIGWAGVLFALLFEVIYKLGVGNLLAAAIGFPTLVIAHYLSFDNGGDTLGVMQAVLDTNFWLATHVVCITLGYTTVFLAGILGIFTILGGLVGGRFDEGQRRQLTRMTYGCMCFGIFFSFVGTVLGGLWADDSWGRFWGWDPKENGALMIVIWCAIVLHARWGKMVGERGLAALAVLGNIVVAWSFFGVNQLGVGLHSYGQTSGVTTCLVVFSLSQIAVAAAAYVAPYFSVSATRGDVAV